MLQVLLNGLVNGAIYSLVAVSVTLIFSILRIPHFGLGGVMVWGAFLAYVAVGFRFGFVWAVGLAALATAILGVVAERLAFRKLRGASEDAMFVSAIGILIVLENSAFLVWGMDSRSIPVEGLDFVISIGGVYLPATRALILVVATAAFLALHVYVRKTKTGKAMRAVAQHPAAAQLLGIPIDRIATFTFAIGSGLAGAAGALVGATFSFTPDMGGPSVVKAFVAVVLGGLGSVLGAIVGGIGLGLIDSLTQMYLSSEFKQAVSFGLLIVVLILRPWGLFGQRSMRADTTGHS